ncbi:MAG: hypothetical protein FJ083_03140 [Cyanobacteria bacterium K_Offshore_surface_m2_239]|nr:hypothetical protein [Cyanobacteria bacterium K_Offshore_surface_m2_239]
MPRIAEGTVSALLLGWLIGLSLVAALLAWRALLAIHHGNSLVTGADLVGQVGSLRLPCGPKERGLVRLSVRGSVIEVPAYSSAGPLRRGQTVMVLEQRGGDVWVTPHAIPRTP